MTTRYDLEILIRTKKEGKGIPEADKEVAGLGKSLNGLLGTVGASAAAVAAAGLVFKKAFDFSREGASLNQLEDSFELLNSQVLKTPGLLDAMSEAARGTIKETDLMAGVLTLTAGQSAEMAQQFAGAAPRLIEIAKAAQKLNPTLGDTNFLYNSIATGIKRSSPLILDNLGIVVKVGEANETYAAQIGKSVDQLTAQEKQVALLNATMAAGDTLIEQVGGNVDSQTDAWDRLTVQIGEGTDSIKQNMAEGLMPWIQLVNGDYHKAIRQIEADNIAAAEATGEFRASMVRTPEGIEELRASIARSSSSFEEYIEKLDAAGVSRSIDTGLGGMTRQWYDQAKAVETTAAQVDEFNEKRELTQQLNERINRSNAEAEEHARVMAELSQYHRTPEEAAAEAQGLERYAVAQANAAKAAFDTERNISQAAIAERELRENARDAANELERQQEASHTAFVDTYTSALNDQTEAFGRWVTTATVVGGRSEDQQANFEELTKKAESLRDNIRSLQGGTAGLGLSEEQLNERLQENYEKLAQVEGSLAPLVGMTAEYSNTTQKWVVDSEVMNQTLFDQIAANTDNEIAITSAGIALGLYDETQIATALNTAIINEKINSLAEAFVAGEITAGQMKERMDDIVANSPYTSEIEVLTDAANAAIDKTRSKLKEMDGMTAHSKIVVTTENRSTGSASSGGASSGGGGRSAAEPDAGMAAGGSFTVPSQFNERAGRPFMLALDGGEKVDVAPAGQASGRSDMGGITVQNMNITIPGGGSSRQMAKRTASMVIDELGKLT